MRRHIRTAIKTSARELSAGGCKTLAILVSRREFDNVEAFTSLVNRLQILNKDLKVITYLDKSRSRPTFVQNFYTPKDFTWKGAMAKPEIKEFLGRSYDVFVGYYTTRDLALDWVTASVKAGLKVGLGGADERLFDLLFKIPPEDYGLFENELQKYIGVMCKSH